ncbi:AbrB/MazE/SpoVT family DNA-binding domain-containing protein [Methylobrevis pamukkalensis]|uniref:Antitoxin PemI n=1 Tax=Methylobrevis pamukkalensis TaxID=1439726 RepID=A0A1E3GYA4_9HYPH|nr:antitoxin [Methylobrevis pamukkalensis]ODN69059.1 Antitoxin PemI [Methylobrevis pamukkalensis]
MHTTNLRKVGGSVMLAVPPALLDVLDLSAGSQVGLSVDQGRLVVEPQPRPRYTLDDLLAQCDPAAEMSDEDRDWLGLEATGDELP